jgi:hypothetical protein
MLIGIRKRRSEGIRYILFRISDMGKQSSRCSEFVLKSSGREDEMMDERGEIGECGGE